MVRKQDKKQSFYHSKKFAMETLYERITLDASICNGKPTIRGKRIAVQSILEYLAAGDTPEEIVAEYPMLTKEDIAACLSFDYV